MREMEQRLEEEEERTSAYNAEKKKLQTSIQDLEEQLVLLILCRLFFVCVHHVLWRRGRNVVGNTTEKNLASSHKSDCTSCRQQARSFIRSLQAGVQPTLDPSAETI